MNRRLAGISTGALLGLACALGGRAAEQPDYVADAQKAVKAGRDAEALKIIETGIAAHPKEARLFNVRAQIHQGLGQYEDAEKDLTDAIGLEGTSGWLFQERAQLRYRLGRLEDAVKDFDLANEMAPKLVPQNWQRGIALYEIGRYADARKQFEEQRKINADDVENAVWHFLSVAKADGLEAAHKEMFAMGTDLRVPMQQIHALFMGKGSEKEVLAAADKGADHATIRTQLFYANLYIALYDESKNETAKEEDALRMALILADDTNYMGVVARIHLARLTAKASKKP